MLRSGTVASVGSVLAVQVTERRVLAGPGAESRGLALASLLRRHMGVVLLLAVAAALRVVAVVAVYPGIWFSDSNGYLHGAATGQLSATRVAGYSLFVAPFYQLGSAGALIIAQHILGLAIVVVLYALLLRRGVPRWLACLAVVPAALDAYLIYLEHTIMSETVFHAALVAAIAVLLSRERLSMGAAVAGGLLLGYAGVVRSVAIPLVAVFVVYLLVRRVGWRPLLVFCVGWALVVGGYATLFDIQRGKFGITEFDGRFLYGKTAPFADCAQLGNLPANERSLCPDPSSRMTPNGYLWGRTSPIHGLPLSADGRVRDFSLRVIRNRPTTYARVVIGDFLHYFEPGHRVGHDDYSVTAWQFPADPRRWHYPGYRGPIRRGSAVTNHKIDPAPVVDPVVGTPHTNVAASRFLRFYQRFAYTSGQILAACVLLVLAALVTRRGARRLRLDAALLAASVLGALVVAVALSIFDYRYGLIAVVFLPVATALAGTGLLQGDAGRRDLTAESGASAR